MAAPTDIPPPPYIQAHEVQDPGEYMYPGDSSVLVQQDTSERYKTQPAPPYGPMSTNQWPAGGGYAPNGQQYMNPCGPPSGYPAAQQGYPGAQPMPQNQVVLMQQNACENPVRTYLRWRLYICLIVVVVKVVVIAIVLAILFGSGNNY